MKSDNREQNTKVVRPESAAEKVVQLNPYAVKEVGITDEAQFRWLVDLAQRDSSGPGARQMDGLEVAVFLALRYPWWPSYGVGDDLVGSIREQLKAGLSELKEKGWWDFEIPTKVSFHWRQERGAVPVLVGGVLQHFFLALRDLLSQMGEQLKVCENPRCSLFFVANRSFQKYCSTRCTNQVSVALFQERERKRELLQRRKHGATKASRDPGQRKGEE